MYLSEKPRPIDFYKESVSNREMMIDTATNHELPPHHHHHSNHQMMLGETSSGGEDHDHEVKLPKKRAETWICEETRSLINYRREVDVLFNTSKSNRHLWEQISAKMREKGFDRSPTMCTDKWRNLLKEFKKARHHHERSATSSAAAKMAYYKELEELLRHRSKSSNGCAAANGGGGGGYKTPTPSKVDAYIQFSDKGLEDAGIAFGSVEANGRPTVNLEQSLDPDGDLAITTADAVAASGVPPCYWREPPGNGAEGHSSYVGRVICVKWMEYTRRIGIDGTADAIKDAIKSAFGLRSNRAFWLEDEDQIVRSLDRDMPIGNYILHLDEGITIKVCLYDDSDRLTLRTDEKVLYTEDDFRDFLTRRGLAGLREFNSGFNRTIDTMDDLRSDAVYHGVRLLGD